MSKDQFGLIPQVTSVMAVENREGTSPYYKRELSTMVSLNVDNYFNFARWQRIEEP